MELLDRVILVVRPRTPFARWALGTESAADLADLRRTPAVYAVEPSNDHDPQIILQTHWRTIFEAELAVWDHDRSQWPRGRTFTMFRQWFEVEVYPHILDLVPRQSASRRPIPWISKCLSRAATSCWCHDAGRTRASLAEVARARLLGGTKERRFRPCIHATQTQADRGDKVVPCGPGGRIRDYVGFYFGPRSPMLLRVHTGHNVTRVDQSDIAYLVSSVQALDHAGSRFVFTDRHSLAQVATFYDDVGSLADVDFVVAYARQWNATAARPDRQEKKQAEFLVHHSMPWTLVETIGVLNDAVRRRVMTILDSNPTVHRPVVEVRRGWYY